MTDGNNPRRVFRKAVRQGRSERGDGRFSSQRLSPPNSGTRTDNAGGCPLEPLSDSDSENKVW